MKILIVAPAWLGDMVMAHTLVRLLHMRYPDVRVEMLAPASTRMLAERMPGVAASHLLEAGHGDLVLRERKACARRLARLGFDQAIVLPNSFKSALVPWWAGIPRRTGWTGEMRYGLLNDRRTLEKTRYPLMIERFMALGVDDSESLNTPYPQPRLQTDADNVARLRERFGLAGLKTVAMCPGAEYGPAKRWPAEHFAATARALAGLGYQIWLLGSARDRETCAEIESLVPNDLVNLAGATGLADVIDVLSQAEAVVSNDSGLMHIACALRRRVIALFGSTSTEFTPPLAEDATVLQLSLDCRPCFQRECPLEHLNCLRQLTPESVVAAVVGGVPQ